MQKGFGFYSPHEATVLFQKATLVSIWIGLDLVVLLTISGLPSTIVERHLLLLVTVLAVLASGTVFSFLFAWITGSQFARTCDDSGRCPAAAAPLLRAMNEKPLHFVGAGAVAALVAIALAVPLVIGVALGRNSDRLAGRANLAVAQKCTEVASLEQNLFRSDERIVMTQCMLQYDKTYAALRGG